MNKQLDKTGIYLIGHADMNKTTEACKTLPRFLNPEIKYKHIYDALVARLKYIGQNNVKSLTEEDIRQVFWDLGYKV